MLNINNEQNKIMCKSILTTGCVVKLRMGDIFQVITTSNGIFLYNPEIGAIYDLDDYDDNLHYLSYLKYNSKDYDIVTVWGYSSQIEEALTCDVESRHLIIER